MCMHGHFPSCTAYTGGRPLPPFLNPMQFWAGGQTSAPASPLHCAMPHLWLPSHGFPCGTMPHSRQFRLLVPLAPWSAVPQHLTLPHIETYRRSQRRKGAARAMWAETVKGGGRVGSLPLNPFQISCSLWPPVGLVELVWICKVKKQALNTDEHGLKIFAFRLHSYNYDQIVFLLLGIQMDLEPQVWYYPPASGPWKNNSCFYFYNTPSSDTWDWVKVAAKRSKTNPPCVISVFQGLEQGKIESHLGT